MMTTIHEYDQTNIDAKVGQIYSLSYITPIFFFELYIFKPENKLIPENKRMPQKLENFIYLLISLKNVFYNKYAKIINNT